MSKKVIAVAGAAGAAYGLGRYLMGKGRLADYIRSEDSPLETAVRVFGNGGQEIHLAGAIHLAEQGYFDAMRQRLDSLDLVLYEAVKASPGSTPDYLALLRRAYKVGAAQLGLAYQMEAIDYEHLPLNWEHCDLSEQEMAASSKGLLYNQAFTSSALYKELIRSFEEQLDDAEQSLGQLAPGSTQKVRSLAGKQMVRMLTSRLHDLERLTVGEFATKDVPLLDENCPLLEAALLLTQSTAPLPVVGADGKLRGMLSRRALLAYLAQQAGL